VTVHLIISAPSLRHSRAGGNPYSFTDSTLVALDSRLRGNDDGGVTVTVYFTFPAALAPLVQELWWA